jgi:hypothetical protein
MYQWQQLPHILPLRTLLLSPSSTSCVAPQ